MSGRESESVAELATRASSEMAEIVGQVSEETMDDVCLAVTRAGRIAVYGVGREGLMMRALTMRLSHLGLDAHGVGEMATPPVGPGDLLIVSAGPGHFATVAALIEVAKEAGAQVFLFTAQSQTSLAAFVDRTVQLPAPTMAVAERGNNAILPMGSAYEGAQFLFFELLVRALAQRLGVDEQVMRQRHTNLE